MAADCSGKRVHNAGMAANKTRAKPRRLGMQERLTHGCNSNGTTLPTPRGDNKSCSFLLPSHQTCAVSRERSCLFLSVQGATRGEHSSQMAGTFQPSDE
eukprot:3131754-Amphidinium_carterae.2